MSEATERNAQALRAMVGNAGLYTRLRQTRLAIVTPDYALGPAVQLLSDYVVDTLCRLWEQVDFHGGLAAAQLSAARDVTDGPSEGMQCAWRPSYDLVVALGAAPPEAAGSPIIKACYDEWAVTVGRGASMGDAPNPAAAAFAAAWVAARVFQWIFRDAMDGAGAAPDEPARLDLREAYGLTAAPSALALPPTAVFGTGAVGHAFLSILERWPHPVTGNVDLVDPDPYGASNMQRYTFMDRASVRTSKVAVRRDALMRRHSGLAIAAHAVDLNVYCQARGYAERLPLAVVGLDSPEARRQAALKLPVRTVNMWTEGKRVGGALYAPSESRACLGCDYLEPKGERMDEAAQLALQTTLLPGEVRRLLDTAEGLTLAQAQKVAAHWQMSVENLVGEPLRSVLPAICATGRVTLPGSTAATEVPFAFASLFAGVSGFMFLLRALEGDPASEGWSQHLFKPPTRLMRQLRGRNEGCVCCAGLVLVNMPVPSAARSS